MLCMSRMDINFISLYSYGYMHIVWILCMHINVSVHTYMYTKNQAG